MQKKVLIGLNEHLLVGVRQSSIDLVYTYIWHICSFVGHTKSIIEKKSLVRERCIHQYILF